MRDEVKSELAIGGEALQAAINLLEDGLIRDAASRVYFVAFHSASAILLSIGERYASHKELISAFGREFAKTGRIDSKFHRYLIDAQELRELADYGTHAPISRERVAATIEQAREFFAMAQQFLEGTGGSIE
ncbi:MAG TPA: HEPN domain-containing protein [Terriglobia bacterium]|nr:HEPN domain-containing protein [Terriglobia bacterium]